MQNAALQHERPFISRAARQRGRRKTAANATEKHRTQAHRRHAGIKSLHRNRPDLSEKDPFTLSVKDTSPARTRGLFYWETPSP